MLSEYSVDRLVDAEMECVGVCGACCSVCESGSGVWVTDGLVRARWRLDKYSERVVGEA